MTNADNALTYSIAREWLSGSIDRQQFQLRASSGGGRGRKGAGAEFSVNSYDVHRKANKSEDITGGPLPPGLYSCEFVAAHPKLHRCIRLLPAVTVKLAGRGGFYIHGRGKHGSDGCIVPENASELHRLVEAIKDASRTVTLHVVDVGWPVPAARSTSGILT
jgi:hypothetical protein